MVSLMDGGSIVNSILGSDTRDSERKKEILQDNVNKKLAEDSLIHDQTLCSIQGDGKLMKDYIVPLGNTSHRFMTNGKSWFRLITNQNGVPDVGLTNDKLYSDFSVHPHAITQIAERYKLPTRYLRDKYLSGEYWQRLLAVTIFNTHIRHEKNKRLLFRNIGNETRGILSSSYKRLNSDVIYNSFLGTATSLGLVVYRVGYAETKSWIEAIYPGVMSFTTPRNGIQHVCFGVRISTSDFGDGALELSFFMLKAWCLNGAVSASELRRVHTGRQIPDDINLSNKTLAHETAFYAGLVSDSMSDIISPEAIKNKVEGIRKASNNEIDFVKTLEKLPKMGMLKTEVEELTNIFTGGRGEDGVEGENTTFKLSQAISAVARSKDARRKRDLEELAGGMIL